MKIVIVGAGKVGVALTRHLAVENRVTVIDQNPHLVENIINIYDVMGVCGNGASYDVQKEADVEQADLLIATTSSDEINILTCLVAKKMGVQHTIARIRSPEYGRQLRFMRSELGLSMAINPEAATAREIARVLRFPTAMKLESFSKGRLELVEYRVAEHTALDGTRLSELYRNFKVRELICAVARQGPDQGSYSVEIGFTTPAGGDDHSLRRFHLAGGRQDLSHRRTPGTGEVLPASGRIPGPGLFGHDRGRQQNVLLSGI